QRVVISRKYRKGKSCRKWIIRIAYYQILKHNCSRFFLVRGYGLLPGNFRHIVYRGHRDLKREGFTVCGSVADSNTDGQRSREVAGGCHGSSGERIVLAR